MSRSTTYFLWLVPARLPPHSQKDSIPSPTFTTCRYGWPIKLVSFPPCYVATQKSGSDQLALIISAKNEAIDASRCARCKYKMNSNHDFSYEQLLHVNNSH